MATREQSTGWEFVKTAAVVTALGAVAIIAF
jgi:hypothetical protein